MNHARPSIANPALIGGVLLGVASGLPLVNCGNCLCCAWIIGGGLLASYLYLREFPSYLPPVTYGEGAVLGMLTGVIGGLVDAVVGLPFTLLDLHFNAASMPEVREALSDPNIPQYVRNLVLQFMAGGGFTYGTVAIDLLFSLLFGVVFATVGSILGVALFQKPRTPMPAPAGPPPVTPSPPPGPSWEGPSQAGPPQA